MIDLNLDHYLTSSRISRYCWYASAGSKDSTEVEAFPAPAAWSLPVRIVFRFCFVYFSLFCLFNQILWGFLPIPGLDLPDLATLPPTSTCIAWVAIHVFRIQHSLVPVSGSGDKIVDWVMTFCLLSAAFGATAIWSLLDRKRSQYVRMAKWFRLGLRFALAGQMFGYGAVKFIPLQMPFPSLARLVEPFGNFSPMGALWGSVGASPFYESFGGSAELLAGLLLILPRTAMLGALICLADMVRVFMLNMTYDVPVKLLSFHLALMALYLLAPELSRLRQFFLSSRSVPASAEPPLFATHRAQHYSSIAQILFGLLLIAGNFIEAGRDWYKYGGGRPQPPLYGIWKVKQLSWDQHVHPLLATENTGFRRVLFDRPDSITIQQMDDTFVRYGATVNARNGTITLTNEDDKNWHGDLRYHQLAPDQLQMEGRIGGHPVQMLLQLLDRNQFLLVNRGFHWVQEKPFNR